MLEVILVRHALAYEADVSRWPNDDLRPLTPEGSTAYRKTAASLAAALPTPEVVLSSPLVRACATAQILAEEAGWPKAQFCEPLSPRGAIPSMLAVLNQYDRGSVALIGHEPGLSRLAASCLAGSAEGIAIEMRKGGLLCIAFRQAPRLGGASLRWFLIPDLATACSDR